MTVTLPVWHREHEIVFSVTDNDAGECSRCRKPLITVTRGWDHRVTVQPWEQEPFIIGEEWSYATRHADGSPNGGCGFFLYPAYRCRECGTGREPTIRFDPYHDVFTCPDCGDTWNRAIGD